VVPLGAGGAAVLPPAGETEIVGALSAYVVVAEMVIEGLWVGKGEGAVEPLAAVEGLGLVLGRGGDGGVV
jgi:hypothetical protein